MISVIFPGQGSQTVGMCSDFYNKFERVKKIFKQVDQILNFPLSDIVLNGPADQLNLTQNTQPSIMMVGYSIYSVLKNEFGINLNNEAKFFAGHSLGEYTALVCSDSLTLETATNLLHQRGKFMQEAVPEGKGSMLAILGLENDKILEEIKTFASEGVCEIANDNCPGQIVVSGEKNVIEKMSDNFKKKSIKSLILPVSAPFHCSLMKKAEENMKSKITDAVLKKPNPGIISNVTAKMENDPAVIKELLIKQITSTVRWRESLQYMINNGIDQFIEIGPGKVLSGLVKRTNRKIKISNLNSLEDINNYKNK
ncbi:MAG: [acyl-carrier-protein] S-malonyltransferase [Pelagibacteraceae bacterium]|nr:[acyl-carrier-protein] S-malonyltransferase [Pelagibacteraceae bacterium]